VGGVVPVPVWPPTSSEGRTSPLPSPSESPLTPRSVNSRHLSFTPSSTSKAAQLFFHAPSFRLFYAWLITYPSNVLFLETVSTVAL